MYPLEGFSSRAKASRWIFSNSIFIYIRLTIECLDSFGKFPFLEGQRLLVPFGQPLRLILGFILMVLCSFVTFTLVRLHLTHLQ